MDYGEYTIVDLNKKPTTKSHYRAFLETNKYATSKASFDAGDFSFTIDYCGNCYNEEDSTSLEVDLI